MNIDVIYKDGAFIPLHPVSIKCNRLTIVVPDDVIQQDPVKPDISAKAVVAKNHSLRNKFDQILGKFARPRSASTPVEDKKAWHDHLMEKHSQ